MRISSHVLARLASLFVLASLAAGSALAAPSAPGFSSRADVRHFIDELAAEHGFDRAVLRRVFANAKPQPSVIAAMQRPLVEPPKWYDYARPFLATPRVTGGVRWWDAHAEDLARAEASYGVPAEVIVAIVGVETFYGRYVGRYRALDALATLAFDYPRRASFFREQLAQFLLLSRELGVSPLAPKGSFAGALGVPQFMPGSYRKFAIDFDGNGRADLWESPADIVGSVAHFLAEHGWEAGEPALVPAVIADETLDTLRQQLEGGLADRQPLPAWAEIGVAPAPESPSFGAQPVGLLALEIEGEDISRASYWIAGQNFYVLTRYNRSRLYAAAVWELAGAIRAARDARQP